MRGMTRGGVAMRAVVFLGPVVALVAGAPQGHAPPVWLLVVVLLMSLGFAALPEHYVGALVMSLVVAWWAIDLPDHVPVAAVGAAAALLAAHVAATIAGYGPDRLPPDRGVVLLWSRRAVLVWLTAPLTLLAVDAEQGRASASYWVAGLACGLVGVLLASALFPTRFDQAT
jgi:hypothetical protein